MSATLIDQQTSPIKHSDDRPEPRDQSTESQQSSNGKEIHQLNNRIGPSDEEILQEEINDKRSTILQKLGLLFHKKTRHCKHKSPDCITHAVEGLISNIKIGIKIRLAITLLQLAFGSIKVKNISIIYQLRFPCFLASFALVSKLIICTLRRLRDKDDGWNGFISGFIAGLTLLINNDPNTKKMFALYLLSRAYGASHNMAESRGMPKIWNQQHLIFICIVQMLFGWLYFCEFNTSIPVSFYAMWNNLYTAFKDQNDNMMRDIMQ